MCKIPWRSFFREMTRSEIKMIGFGGLGGFLWVLFFVLVSTKCKWKSVSASLQFYLESTSTVLITQISTLDQFKTMHSYLGLNHYQTSYA